MRWPLKLGSCGLVLLGTSLGMVIGCGRPLADGAKTPTDEEAQVAERPESDPSTGAVSDPHRAIKRLVQQVSSYPARARLIRIGPPALPYLFAQVSGPDMDLADESIGTIRWIVRRWRDQPEAVPQLIEEVGGYALGTAPADRREFAVDLLGDLGGETSVAKLDRALDDPALASTAALALGRIEGGGARRALTESLEGAAANQRALIYSILGRRAEAESIPLLIEAAKDDDEAVAALAGFHDPEVLSWLLAATRRGSDAALAALLASDAVREDGSLLAQVAGSVTSRADREAVASLIRSPEQYHSDLEAALLDMPTSGSLGRARAKALLNLSTRLDPTLAASVARQALNKYQDPIIAPRALRVCAQLCPPSAAKDIGRALTSRNASVRLAAVEALSGMDGEPASTELHEAIQRADIATAVPLIRALGARHDATAVRALLHLSEAPKEELRETFLSACLLMAPELPGRRPAALIWARSLDLGLTVEALEGLGRVASGNQLPQLEAVLESTSGALQDAAREAVVSLGRRLGERGDRGTAIDALATAFRYRAPVEHDLRRLGERVELVAHGGRIDAWWRLLGQPSPSGCTSTEPPTEQLLGLATMGQDSSHWQPLEAADTRGILSLSVGDSTPAPPYWLVADLVPRAAVPISILMRSTVAAHFWLNGEPLEAEPRKGKTDEVRFEATLAARDNQLVLRVCSEQPEVLLGIRLEGADGRPLKFKIR